VKVVPIHAHEGLSMRALVTQARTKLAGHARLHKVVFDRGLLDGVELWWLAQHGITFVVPAKDHMAVTADARAPAAAGADITAVAACTPCAMGRAERRGPSGWQPRWSGAPG
jgi:hypothetical protein